ncbi:hypothetical protein AKJ41_02090 [candidate division MSBL1 archaeon SCGC-AAA259O05]|uniref:Uncharacterized protein n=1 Tax=candidate division MSBL1 archaeon SCGC-AAA259O05 TaxID=1698271 RepID=A0A133V4H2_9EURY|nr:hypothetical protein AKJ41_02090 [candidate division MSBL1 archaeon SCGC-AAA259O05]
MVIKIEDFTFDCDYCDFENTYDLEDVAHDEARDHLVDQHPEELREKYPGKGDKCLKCDSLIKGDLICRNGHDNINWYAGLLVRWIYGLKKS